MMEEERERKRGEAPVFVLVLRNDAEGQLKGQEYFSCCFGKIGAWLISKKKTSRTGGGVPSRGSRAHGAPAEWQQSAFLLRESERALNWTQMALVVVPYRSHVPCMLLLVFRCGFQESRPFPRSRPAAREGRGNYRSVA